MHNLGIDSKVPVKTFLHSKFVAESNQYRLNGPAGKGFGASTQTQGLSLSQPYQLRQGNPQQAKYGDEEALKQTRRQTDFRYYEDFTKRFDQEHNKTKLRGRI